MEEWYSTYKIPNKNFVCGYCGKDINSNRGYFLSANGSHSYDGNGFIYICHHCNKPTFISSTEQVPGAKYGKEFNREIFDDELIYDLYEEARNCMKAKAYTSVGMCCRKMLMHIGVNCGAEVGKTFKEYVDYLDNNNFIPTNCKEWVDIIRTKGNEATHEIIILNREEATQLIKFTQMIISVIYEMKYEASKYLKV